MASGPVEYDSNHSYSEDSFETAEESQASDWRESSPVVWSRRESVFLAESSISSEENTNYRQEDSSSERCEIVSSAKDEKTRTRSTESSERNYSEHYESCTASTSGEDKYTGKDEDISEEKETQETFIKKKLAVLCTTQSCFKEDEKEMAGVKRDITEENEFCLKKLNIAKIRKQETDPAYLFVPNNHCSNGPTLVARNRGQIENLKIENLMSKMKKVQDRDFHDPNKCTDCRSMKSQIANCAFLKRKLEIVRRPEFEANLQEHLYQKDSATLIAEIANACTKASTAPVDVWDRLLHKQTK